MTVVSKTFADRGSGREDDSNLHGARLCAAQMLSRRRRRRRRRWRRSSCSVIAMPD